MDLYKVLIIDHELISRQGIRHMIEWEKAGFQIVGEATDGRSGLEMVERLKPDIVLADVLLPEINGMDLSLILGEKYPRIKLIILSGSSDYMYVRSTLRAGAFDYVLKQDLDEEQLLRVLHSAVSAMQGNHQGCGPDDLARRHLEQYMAGESDWLDKSLFAEKFPYMHYCVIGIDLSRACGSSRHQMDMIRTYLQDTWCGQERYPGIEVSLDSDVLCYVFNFRKKDEAQLVQSVRQAAEVISRIAERTLFVVSGTFSDLGLVNEFYLQEVFPCLMQKFYFPDQSMILSSDYLSGEYAAGEVPAFDYDAFVELLSNKRYIQAIDCAGADARMLCGGMYAEYLTKNRVKNLIYTFMMNARDCGLASDTLINQCFISIDRAGTVRDFLEICDTIFEQLKKTVMASEENDDYRIRRIKDYLWEHSGRNVDLSEVARVFGFNYHYISSYFNKHISEGFSGYLNKIRIEKACALLRDKKIPVSDVGCEVGYSDHGYFCRVFKRLKGLTPSQYRQKMQDRGQPARNKSAGDPDARP